LELQREDLTKIVIMAVVVVRYNGSISIRVLQLCRLLLLLEGLLPAERDAAERDAAERDAAGRDAAERSAASAFAAATKAADDEGIVMRGTKTLLLLLLHRLL
jgi:hypothetical protein